MEINQTKQEVFQSNINEFQPQILNEFQEDYLYSVCEGFQLNEQEFIVIWGDANANQDNDYVVQQLVEKYPFLEQRIYQFQTSLDFRKNSIKLSKRNILFILSGTFANEKNNQISNIEWVNKQIYLQKIHSKSIIIFTSLSSIQKNEWSIEKLQQQFKYVTQLSIDFNSLFISLDKMIYNRIHRSFVQCKHLDFYFRAETQSILNIFQNLDSFSFEDIKINTQDLLSKFTNLCEYLKESEVQAPLTLYLSQEDLQITIQSIESCFEENGANQDENKIIQNFIKLYTQETPIYKILNLSLNTMNPKIYNYLKDLYLLFSKCLYLYDDQSNIAHIQLYRGTAIQKYQYDMLYEEYLFNQQNNIQTYIVFPQFLSTSDNYLEAKKIVSARLQEVEISNTNREQNLDKFSLRNKEYLKSEDFKNTYRVLINIAAKLNCFNKYKPKSIKRISQFTKEGEYLFQPYQIFQIIHMEQGFQVGDELNMTITYSI